MFTTISELDVVNSCLGAIGMNPVTGTTSTNPNVTAAITVFNRVSRAIQTQGWWFNQEYKLLLQPETDGTILLPEGTLKFYPTHVHQAYVIRAGKLYDPVKHTNVIGQAVKGDLIMQFDIQDIPITAADWIMKQTTYEFYRNDDGDKDKVMDLKLEAERAKMECRKENFSVAKMNSQDRPINLLMMSRIRGPLGNVGAGVNPALPGG
ncbi:MAG TPA: hypothetical protein VNZ45_16800 [Bacteroidia bacterium]|jgi:hypothetical protein|nr:hypothetical protein [Bacteroidia bacterium]